MVQHVKSFEIRSAWRVKSDTTDYFDLYSGSRAPLAAANNNATTFSCDSLATDAVRAVCTAAQGLGLDKVPLADGVQNLDRTLVVEVNSPTSLPLDASNYQYGCPETDCNIYSLPPVTSFRFNASAAETDSAQTRGGSGQPMVQFDCDAATDMYTLVFWDALGFFGGFSTITSKGFLHGAWTNIRCTADKKANFGTAATLMPYSPPYNPSAAFPNNYGFYLFKQKSEVALGNDGTLAGFDPRAFQSKARTIFLAMDGLDIEEVLAPLRPSLQEGGPKARTWANVKSSPFSAMAIKYNYLGQCGGERAGNGGPGLGGPVDVVKAAWSKYKIQDKNCTGVVKTGCRVFDEWLASKGGDYDTAIAQGVTSAEKFVLCEAYHATPICQRTVSSKGLATSWDAMCQDLKGKSGSEFLFDLQANPDKVYHIIGLKHIVAPGLEKHIHHMTVDGRLRGKAHYEQFLWGWALGMDAFLFPEECGVKLGGDGIVSMKINIHYDNPYPHINVGKLDTSGIEVSL